MEYIGQLVLTIDFLFQTALGNDKEGLQVLDNDGCQLCPGESQSYECTVIGGPGGTTVWTGTAFNCTGREIILFHGDYESTDGAYDKCGDMVGWSINPIDGNTSTGYFVSQAIVPINSYTAGKTVDCEYDDGKNIVPVGELTIPVTMGLFAPDQLYMSSANFVSTELTFSWSPVAPDCPAIHYNILASNCGSCPTTTNHTSVTCTDVPINNSVCIFALETVVCGNVTGNATKPIRVSVKVKEQQTIKVLKDLYRIPSFIGIAVLLLIIILAAVVFFFIRFIKKINTSEHSQQFNEQIQINQNSCREDDIATTIKTFDNIKMGNYSLSDEDHYQQPNLISEDDPINLSNILQKFKGQIASQWYQIGMELGVPKDILDQLNNYSDEDRTVEILDYWLRHHSGKPTWQEVAEAKKRTEYAA